MNSSAVPDSITYKMNYQAIYSHAVLKPAHQPQSKEIKLHHQQFLWHKLVTQHMQLLHLLKRVILHQTLEKRNLKSKESLWKACFLVKKFTTMPYALIVLKTMAISNMSGYTRRNLPFPSTNTNHHIFGSRQKASFVYCVENMIVTIHKTSLLCLVKLQQRGIGLPH